MEAEYIGMCSTDKNGSYIINLLTGVYPDVKPAIIFCDNVSASIYSGKESTNERTKHIDIAFHYVRQKIKEAIFTIKHVQLAD